jgi:hypothetical protein
MFYFLKRTRNPRKETCGFCEGKGYQLDESGILPIGKKVTCYACAGTGQIWHRDHGLINCYGYQELLDEVRKGSATKRDCEACDGLGAIYDKNRKWWQFWKPIGTHCEKCAGLGHYFDGFEEIEQPKGYLKEYLKLQYGYEGGGEESEEEFQSILDRIEGDDAGCLGNDKYIYVWDTCEDLGFSIPWGVWKAIGLIPITDRNFSSQPYVLVKGQKCEKFIMGGYLTSNNIPAVTADFSRFGGVPDWNGVLNDIIKVAHWHNCILEKGDNPIQTNTCAGD